MIGYKIFTKKQEGRLLSMWIIPPFEYKIGMRNYPIDGNGPFAIFDTLENLYKFIPHRNLGMSGLVAYRCEYEPSDEKHLYIIDGLIIKYSDLPKGTQLASWIELLEEVNNLE